MKQVESRKILFRLNPPFASNFDQVAAEQEREKQRERERNRRREKKIKERGKI